MNSFQHPISNTQFPTGEGLDQKLGHWIFRVGYWIFLPWVGRFCQNRLLSQFRRNWPTWLPSFIFLLGYWIFSRLAGSRRAGRDIGYSSAGCSFSLLSTVYLHFIHSGHQSCIVFLLLLGGLRSVATVFPSRLWRSITLPNSHFGHSGQTPAL